MQVCTFGVHALDSNLSINLQTSVHKSGIKRVHVLGALGVSHTPTHNARSRDTDGPLTTKPITTDKALVLARFVIIHYQYCRHCVIFSTFQKLRRYHTCIRGTLSFSPPPL